MTMTKPNQNEMKLLFPQGPATMRGRKKKETIESERDKTNFEEF